MTTLRKNGYCKIGLCRYLRYRTAASRLPSPGSPVTSANRWDSRPLSFVGDVREGEAEPAGKRSKGLSCLTRFGHRCCRSHRLQSCERLLQTGCAVVGVDTLNAYYDPALKEARLAVRAMLGALRSTGLISLIGGDGGSSSSMAPSARSSIWLPRPGSAIRWKTRRLSRLQSRRFPERAGRLPASGDTSPHLRFVKLGLWRQHGQPDLRASAGRPPGQPPRRHQACERTDGPRLCLALQDPDDGLLVFTVYGPWGRPDMAPGIFAKAIATGQPVRLFNDGHIAATSPMSTMSSRPWSA